VGIDSSPELIARCTQSGQGARKASKRQIESFWVADIARSDWTNYLPQWREESETGTFDCILLLAVLHHIPGSDMRARIMQQVRELLASQGRAIISTWQFMDNERMRKKIVPWSTVGIDELDLEPGDALLDWKRSGTGLRYCHWIGEDEMRALAAQAGMQVVETFRAGGREGNLSLYAVLSST